VNESVVAQIAAMAKYFATNVAMRVTTDAVQLFGKAGVSAEYPIYRRFRDAKVLQVSADYCGSKSDSAQHHCRQPDWQSSPPMNGIYNQLHS
jgi:hypothetical protein